MNRLVLIADGDPGRRQRIMRALEAANLDIEVAPDGAAALEVALRTRPSIVVAESDVGLVDAFKLAEILRANPHTRSARFVFLGEAAHAGEGPGVCDMVLPGDVAVEDLVDALEGGLAFQAEAAELDARIEAGGRATGDFDDLPPAELIYCLHAAGRSGRVDLRREGDGDGQRRGSVWLHDGEIVDAELGDSQGRKALFRLLGWGIGRYTFDPSGLHVSAKPLAPLRALVTEGRRQHREWQRMATQLPPLDCAIHLRIGSAELPNVVHPLTQEVLSLLAADTCVRDVVDHCSFPDYQVLRTLHTLEEREIIALEQATTIPASRRKELLEPGQVRRIRDWLPAPSNADEPVVARLVVAASSGAVLQDFAALLGRAEGATLSPDFVAGRVGIDSLAPIGRLEAGGGLRLEFLHVPVDSVYAALWPAVGYGALGTLFLLAAPVSEAASRIQPLSDALRRLPRSRIFHLFIFHKEERPAPAEIGENLSLIDEASLFMLPLENGKSPHALLRSVFARIAP